MTTSKTLVATSGFFMIVALATPGCATKKYARQQAGAVVGLPYGDQVLSLRLARGAARS